MQTIGKPQQPLSRDADDLTDNYLSDLSNVATTGIQTGDLIYYNGSTWVDIATSSLALNTDDTIEGSALYYTDERVATYVSGSSSIPNIEGGPTGTILEWNGTAWATTSTSTLAQTLDGLTDVDTTDKTAGNILYWTGTEWEETSTSTLVADADLGNLTESTSALTITGGTGSTVGNVSITVDSDVDALATLGTNGIMVRDGAGSLTTRTLTAGSQAFSVTNGSGTVATPPSP